MKGSFGAMDGVAVLWLRGRWIQLCCVVSLSLPSWELHSFKLNSCCGCCICYNLLTNAANCCDNLVLKILKTLILRLHTAISKPWFMNRTGLLLVHAHVIKFECWHLQVTLGCLRLFVLYYYGLFDLGTCFLISFLDANNNYKNPIFCCLLLFFNDLH